MKVITLSGYPGSGTSTVLRLLSESTGLRAVNAGDIFREMAKDHGQELADFADYVRRHPEIDRKIDDRSVELARAGDLILEGRLAGHMTRQAGVPALRVWFACPRQLRVSRVADREGLDEKEALRRVQQREVAERERYIDFYGFDLDDLSFYDHVMDTEALRPEPIAKKILASWEAGQ